MSSTNPTFLATADLHIGHKLYNSPELEADMLDNFRRVCSAAVSRKVDYVVLAGDVFDDNNPRPDSVAAVKEQVDRLAQHGIKVVGIAGDHDRPVNNSTWVNLAGIEPVTSCPYFAGVDYYDYSSVSRADYLSNLLGEVKRESVKWLFLHGQVPALFKFTEPKKKLDFSDWDVFNVFPSLKGVILGDIHEAQDGELKEGDRSVFIGYCGSPSINDLSETRYIKQILYYDGVTLQKLPFLQERKFVLVNFKGDNHEIFNVADLLAKYSDEVKKPVFVIEVDPDTPAEARKKLAPLYAVGMVKEWMPKEKRKIGDVEETLNVRSELGTGERIVHVLRRMCDDRGLIDRQYQLALSVLTGEDPTQALDKYKQEVFNKV